MMVITVSILFLTVLAAMLNTRTKQGVQIQEESSHRKLFCIIASLLWIAISSLRDESIGADTASYKRHFEALIHTPLPDLWRALVEAYTADLEVKAPGYSVLTKLLQFISKDYRFLLLFIAVLFFAAMGVWIYRYSQMPYISFLLFSTLFYSFYALTGHRQTIATALVVFVGHELIKNRKFIPFLLLIFLVSTIHNSSWCYLPVYFIYPIRGYSRRTYLFVLLITLFASVGMDSFWQGAAEFLGYGGMMDNDIGGTETFTFFYFLVFFVAIWRFPSIVASDPNGYHTFNILFFGTILVLMAYINQSFMRVQQYYTLHLMLLLPNIVTSFKGRERFIVGAVGCGLLLFLMIRNTPTYLFFWQAINL